MMLKSAALSLFIYAGAQIGYDLFLTGTHELDFDHAPVVEDEPIVDLFIQFPNDEADGEL